MIVSVKITSEPSNVDEEHNKYRQNRRRRLSAALSTPPAVHVHIGSDGLTSNGSISSRGNTVTTAGDGVPSQALQLLAGSKFAVFQSPLPQI